MAVKKYIATIACRDDLTRTITIMKESSVAETIEMVVTACSTDMDSSDDAFTPFRKTTGSITIYNQFGRIDPQDLMPTSAKSHIVSIVNSNGVCEFYGYVGMETRSQNYPFAGDTFDIPIVDMFSVANAFYMQKSNSTTLVNSQRTMLELIYYALGKIGFDSSLHLPKLFVPDSDMQPLNYADAYNVETTLFNVNTESNLDEDDPDYEYWEGITVEEFLEKVAKFYGFTWVQYGYEAYAVAQDVTDYLSFDIEQQISEDDVSSETIQMASIKKETGNSIDYIAQPSKVSVIASRNESDIITGLDADDWVYSKYNIISFRNNLGISFNSFKTTSKNGLSNFKKYGSDISGYEAAYGGQFVEFEFYKNSGNDKTSTNGEGIMILPFSNGIVDPDSATTKLTSSKVVATFYSPTIITADDGYIEITAKGNGILRHDADDEPVNYDEFCDLSQSGYGTIYCKVYVGGVEVTNSSTRTLSFFDPTDDDFKTCTTTKKVQLSNLSSGGTIKIEICCKAGSCFMLMLSDIKVEYNNGGYKRLSNVEDRSKSTKTEFKWYEKTGFSGDAYEHNIDWNSYHINQEHDTNTLLNIDGTPFITVTGSYGSYSYEKFLCKRITDIYEHKSYRMHIVTRLGAINSSGITMLPIATIGRHIVTGFSRDYGAGTDTIHLDSF